MPSRFSFQAAFAACLFLASANCHARLLLNSPRLLVADSTAQQREARTLQRGVVQRRPGEADSTFLRRILPLSYSGSHDWLAYAWRPSSFGKQLFFSAQGQGGDFDKCFFFIVDPFQANTCAVQAFELVVNSDCDLPPEVDAIFFADVDQNGQKELLVLAHCSTREPAGQALAGHVSNYGTQVYQFAGINRSGRPAYRPEPVARPYLDGLETAAEVRLSLARHQRRSKLPPRKILPQS